MKALSIRQPWAELIISGRKTVELRSWPVNYRGPLAIHAAQTVDREACAAHGLDPEAVATGAVIGIVELTAVEPLEAETYAALRGAHLGHEVFKPPLFGWQLQNPQRWPVPVLARGKMALFEVPDPKPQAPTAAPEPAAPAPDDAARNGRGTKPKTDNAERPFELRVLPGTSTYSLALFQQMVPGRDVEARYPTAKANRPNTQNVRVADLSGPALRAVTDQVQMRAARRSGAGGFSHSQGHSPLLNPLVAWKTQNRVRLVCDSNTVAIPRSYLRQA